MSPTATSVLTVRYDGLVRTFAPGNDIVVRIVLDQLSWITPARWGFASSASTVALRDLVPPPITPADALWDHKFRSWGFDMAMLAGLSIVYLGFVRWKIRLRGG